MTDERDTHGSSGSGSIAAKEIRTPHPLFNEQDVTADIVKVMTVERVIKFDYTNWRGERGIRTVIPLHIAFKTSDHHKEMQWMILAWDVDKRAWRSFPLKDIHGFVS